MNEDLSGSGILSYARILITLQILIEQHCRAPVEIERCRGHLPESAEKGTGIRLDAILEESGQRLDEKLLSFFVGLGLDTVNGFFLCLNVVG